MEHLLIIGIPALILLFAALAHDVYKDRKRKFGENHSKGWRP